MGLERLAVDEHLASVGVIKTVDDAHQGRLAGAIFANDAVNTAFLNFEADLLVGVHFAEPLVDTPQFDGIAICLVVHAVPAVMKKG